MVFFAICVFNLGVSHVVVAGTYNCVRHMPIQSCLTQWWWYECCLCGNGTHCARTAYLFYLDNSPNTIVLALLLPREVLCC